MKVLVTGGCGFLGSHVCELFASRNWDVIACDNMTKYELKRNPYNSELARDYNYNILSTLSIPIRLVDITDLADLKELAADCNYIVHTAAQPAMTIATELPMYDFYNNVVGTLNVLEVGRQLNIPVAICSTIHVYGNSDINKSLVASEDTFKRYPKAIAEDSPLLGGIVTPLHASKRACELYALAYINSYNSAIAVFRLTGIYGPRQFGGEDHGWIANFAIRAMLNLPIKVFGTDKQVRDILYASDAANAFLDWFQSGTPSGIYNIGGGEACLFSIKQHLQFLEQSYNTPLKVDILPARFGDLWYFCSDITKARQAFNWQPTTFPLEGVYELLQWLETARVEGVFDYETSNTLCW